MGDGYLRPVSEHVDGAEEGFAAAVGLGQNPFCHSAAVYASTGQVQPGSVEGGGVVLPGFGSMFQTLYSHVEGFSPSLHFQITSSYCI